MSRIVGGMWGLGDRRTGEAGYDVGLMGRAFGLTHCRRPGRAEFREADWGEDARCGLDTGAALPLGGDSGHRMLGFEDPATRTPELVQRHAHPK